MRSTAEPWNEKKKVGRGMRKRLLVFLVVVLWYCCELLLWIGRLWYPDVFTGVKLTRFTIWIALAYYFPALMLMLRLDRSDWINSQIERLALMCWTLSWLAYLVHVGTAFHFHHNWSHDHAFAHTQEQSGFGGGIYVNYVFTILWTFDVLWWMFFGTSYRRRARWIGWTLHAFMVFIVANATIVFEDGPIRWMGAVGFVWLAWMWYNAGEKNVAGFSVRKQ